MKSRIWRLAGVGLLCMSVGAQALAENQGDDNQKREGEHEHRPEGHPQNNQPRPQAPAPRPAAPEVRPQAPKPRPAAPAPQVRPENNPQHFERHEQAPAGQWQGHPPQNEPAQAPRPAPQNNLPIQPHPDSVRQTQEPVRGNYSDIPGATVTPRIGRVATITIVLVATSSTTTIVAGRVVPMVTAMAGAQARNIALAM